MKSFYIGRVLISFYKKINDNSLGLENKMFSIEQVGATLRNKFGADNNISDVVLREIFLSEYPMYSCKIKKSINYVSKKSCGCC